MTQEFLAHFSWRAFAFITVLYTLAPILSSLRWSNYGDIRKLMMAVRFSPLSAITIHILFLSVLLVVFWISTHYYSVLPDWFKRPSIVGLSVLDFAALLVLVFMIAIEDRIIRAGSGTQ